MSRISIGRLGRNVLVGSLALVWTLPTYLLLVNAMTPVSEYAGTPVWWPTGFGLFENIAAGWTRGDFTTPMLNSLFYSVVGSAASVMIGALGAYALVVLPVRRRTMWFWVIYAGTLLPLQVFAVPLYLAAAELGIYDTRTILLIVYTALCIPFTFFISRNFLTTIPRDVVQAGKLDGASHVRLFRSVILPVMRPALAAGFVFQFIYIWNELFFGISLTIKNENLPVMAALAGLQGQGGALSQPAILATALVVALPAVLIFLFFQRFFVSGLTANI